PEKAEALAILLADIGKYPMFNEVRAWQLLRQRKGIVAANAWLRPRIDDDEMSAFARIAHAELADELIWSFIDAEKHQDTLFVLALAAAKLRIPKTDPRMASLIAIAQKQDNPFGRALYGYLLGDQDAQTVIAFGSTSPDARAFAAYFLGVRTAADGNYDRALPWILAATLSSDAGTPVHGGIDLLRLWCDAKMSWNAVKKK